jgi:hypothetical protein
MFAYQSKMLVDFRKDGFPLFFRVIFRRYFTARHRELNYVFVAVLTPTAPSLSGNELRSHKRQMQDPAKANFESIEVKLAGNICAHAIPV